MKWLDTRLSGPVVARPCGVGSWRFIISSSFVPDTVTRHRLLELVASMSHVNFSVKLDN